MPEMRDGVADDIAHDVLAEGGRESPAIACCALAPLGGRIRALCDARPRARHNPARGTQRTLHESAWRRAVFGLPPFRVVGLVLCRLALLCGVGLDGRVLRPEDRWGQQETNAPYRKTEKGSTHNTAPQRRRATVDQNAAPLLTAASSLAALANRGRPRRSGHPLTNETASPIPNI